MNDLLALDSTHAPEGVIGFTLIGEVAGDVDAAEPASDAWDDAEVTELQAVIAPETIEAAEVSSEDAAPLVDGDAAAVEEADEDGDAHDGVPVFDDEFPILAQGPEASGDALAEAVETPHDPRLSEMRDVLVTLRDSEVSAALRLLRQLFPHIPFPFRVRALMAVRHGAVLG